MKEKDKFKKICKITTDVLELPEGSLKGKSRMMELCLGREIAATIGVKNGIHRKTIAKYLNKDRTSINYYTGKHKTNFEGWIPYAKAYTKILNIYEEIKNNKKVFLEKIWIQKHLENSGIKQSADPEICFTIKSGKVKYDLLSDYSKFSNHYDNLNEVLKEYDYSLNWRDL